MIYVPILKNRQFEMMAAKKTNKYFSSKVIPLFEIINNKYVDQYKVDPITQKFATEIKPGNSRATRIKLPHTSNDIITIDHINNTINSQLAFIDYYRYVESEYSGLKIDPKSVQLSLTLSRDYNQYKSHLLSLSNYDNLIPVINIKKDLEIPLYELKSLIEELQSQNSSIALRVTANLCDKFNSSFSLLRDNDYLMCDIREQNIASQFMYLTDVSTLNLNCKTILLNSPRKLSIKNTQYEEHDFTSLIDNLALEEFSSYGFDGVGDFGGLKDALPEYQAGSNGKGSALALIYFYDKNIFMSLRNPDTSLGPKGYKSIKSYILQNKKLFNPYNNCIAMDAINNMPNCGSFGSWNCITLTRYIHQIYLNI